MASASSSNSSSSNCSNSSTGNSTNNRSTCTPFWLTAGTAQMADGDRAEDVMYSLSRLWKIVAGAPTCLRWQSCARHTALGNMHNIVWIDIVRFMAMCVIIAGLYLPVALAAPLQDRQPKAKTHHKGEGVAPPLSAAPGTSTDCRSRGGLSSSCRTCSTSHRA